MGQLKLIIQQFRDLFIVMNGAQRLSVMAFAGAVLILIMVFLMKATAPQGDKPLFFQVTETQAATITEKLDDMRIDWKYQNGAILVGPEVNTEHLKMNLAQDGLLPEDMSFDFEKMIESNNFALTKDERADRWGLALENVLAKTIMSMDDINDAKVRITKEEASPLLKRHVPRKASVMLRVRGNRSLTKVEVQGIISFVASSVKGLDHDKVSITDGRGRSYNLNDDTGAADKLEMTWKAERHFAEKIESLLLEFIPRVKATVSLSLDLEKRRREVKDYAHSDLSNGATSVLVQNESEKEDSTSKEGTQGVVGAGTNSEAEIKEGDGGNEMKMGKSSKRESFDNSLIQEFIEYDGLKMTVAGVSVVVVDKKLNALFDDDPSQAPYTDMNWLASGNEQAGASIEELVAAAIGLVSPDIVKVTQQHMHMPEKPTEAGAVESFLSYFDAYLVLMGILAIVGGLLLVNMIKKAQPEEEILEMPEYEEEEKKSELPPLKEPEMDPGILQVNNRVKEIIEEDPLKAASLIRHWMSGE